MSDAPILVVIPDGPQGRSGTQGPVHGTYYVYILASQRNGTLYVGVTGDLARRISEHRQGLVPGFTKKYDVKTLVWFEDHRDISQAILREKRLKRWRRGWKIALIEADNPQWLDRWDDLFAPPEAGPLSELARQLSSKS